MQTEFDRGGLADGQINLACFEVRGQLYALDVGSVREIVRYQEVTPLPKAPELIEGVAELRGSIVPIIDLGRALGGDPIDTSNVQARIAVLECDGLVVGMVVQAATDVLSLEAVSIEEPPALATQAGYDAIRAVVRLPESAPVMVLSLDHILESVYRSALSEKRESL